MSNNITEWIRNKDIADAKINQYKNENSERQTQLTTAEKTVLERLAKRQGYSQSNQESSNLPSTINAYYRSEWYAIKRKQQQLTYMVEMTHANEKLIPSCVKPYMNPEMSLHSFADDNIAREHQEIANLLYLKQKRDKEKKAELDKKQKQREYQQRIHEDKYRPHQVIMINQQKIDAEEKKRQEKVMIQNEKVKKELERRRKEAEALEEQKRRNREDALQKQQLQIEKMKEREPISKQIDEQLARRIKEQPQLPKKPEPIITAEKLENAKREKTEREIAIRLAKQREEQLYKKEHNIELERKMKKQDNIAYTFATPELKEAKRKSDRASQQLDIIFNNEAKLHKSRTELPPIYIILLCFNESVILPLTIAHYRARFPSCEFIIYDNESTDQSVMIAKELGCRVISWSSNQINDESLKIKIRNHCWRHITEGWIIMADMDEWIYITEEELKQEEEHGTTILSIEGMEMVGESNTLDLSDIYLSHISRYVPFVDESKNLCFFRSKISSMNFGPGSHTCTPIGTVVFSTTFYQLRHMCKLGLPFLLDKMKKRYQRSALNRSNGWSIHYITDEKKITEDYNKLLLESISF